MKNKLKILIIVLKIFVFSISVYSHFEDLPVGARVAGLNNTATAIGEDIFTGYFNPAGLENLENFEIGVDYNKLYLGLSDGSDISSNVFLFGKKVKKIGGIIFGYRQVGLTNYYVENKYSIGVGRKTKFLDREINVGTKINFFNKSFGKTIYTENAVNLLTGEVNNGVDPVFASGYSKSAIGFDLGVIYSFLENNYIGLVLENINQPDIGLSSLDIIPMNIKLGYKSILFDLKVMSDLHVNDKNVIFSFGAEREINLINKDKIILRGGLGLGSREYANLSFGASYSYRKIFQLDYSFNYLLKGITNYNGSHQISFIVKFDDEFFKKF